MLRKYFLKGVTINTSRGKVAAASDAVRGGKGGKSAPLRSEKWHKIGENDENSDTVQLCCLVEKSWSCRILAYCGVGRGQGGLYFS